MINAANTNLGSYNTNKKLSQQPIPIANNTFPGRTSFKQRNPIHRQQCKGCCGEGLPLFLYLCISLLLLLYCVRRLLTVTISSKFTRLQFVQVWSMGVRFWLVHLLLVSYSCARFKRWSVESICLFYKYCNGGYYDEIHALVPHRRK